MEIKNTKDVSCQFIKTLVYGNSGAGKTKLCATAGQNPFIISVEGGLLSVADHDLDFVEVRSMAELREAYEYLLTDITHDWVCLDSISEIAEVVLTEEKKKTPDGRKAYGELNDILMLILRNFRDLPKNVYFSAKQDKIKDESTGGIIYGPAAPGSKLGPAMPYLFDLVMCLQTWKDTEGKIQRALQTQGDSQYVAKDRSGKLELAEAPDLNLIYNKIINQPKGD